MSESVKNNFSKQQVAENSIFNRLGEYEMFRYLRRGGWNIVALIIVVVFFTITENLKSFWPKKIENEGHFYFFTVYGLHQSCFIICNLVMLVIYKSRVFECYKTFKDAWPWDENYSEWKNMLVKTFKYLFVNQCIVLPLSLFSYYYFNTSANSVLYEDLPDLKTLFLHLGIFLVCEDFTFYWAHRILHIKSIYPYIHKIHHQYRLVVGISTEYCHPFEYVVANLLASSSGALLMGKNTHLFTYYIWVFIRICETTDGHSGYEFPWSPYRLLAFSAGQEYHNYHHLNFDGNYGSFLTIWDRIFNTTNKAFLNFINNKYENEYLHPEKENDNNKGKIKKL